MLTKKEKLLTRPWVVQRYQSHRKKVKSATPAIDFRTPKDRPHVEIKHKKRQKELERRKEIEQENVRLLQKLAVIMNTLRLDNYWKNPRPSFLKREFIYEPKSATKTPQRSRSSTTSPQPSTATASLRGSAKRCPACNKDKPKPQPRSNQVSPQPRIPWEAKNYWNRTLDFEPVNCCQFCCKIP